MADVEKPTAVGTTSPHATTPSSSDIGDERPVTSDTSHTRPNGWIYRSPQLFGRAMPWFASPKTQLFMVSLVCFLCPGMFNAVNGLGGGGQVDQKPSDDALTALYATFSVVGFFAGTIANRLGIKISLSIGGFGYCLYVAALLCYNHTQNAPFLIFAGAMLGVCAGLLWTAQGAIMMSYPPEESKGQYIAWFWMIFNMGAVIGSLVCLAQSFQRLHLEVLLISYLQVPLGQNISVMEKRTVNDGTYIAFIVLMFIGACLGLFLVNAGKVIREDGSKVILMQNPTWKSEIIGLWDTIRTHTYVVFLFPMFFASNWFYTYQFNAVNGAHFNTRTGALNNTLYWVSQIIGAFVFGFLLDLKVRRSYRAKGCLFALFSITMIIWGGGWAWQRQQPTRAVAAEPDYPHIDWVDDGYLGPMFLYMFYGFYDAAWQTSVYW